MQRFVTYQTARHASWHAKSGSHEAQGSFVQEFFVG